MAATCNGFDSAGRHIHWGIHVKVGDQLPYDSLRAISRFPRLQYVEINTATDCGPVPEVSLVEDLWFDVLMAEEAFRYIAAKKKRSTISELPLKGLDFKRYDWGPHLESPSRLSKNPAVPVYACRWAGGGSQGEQVRVFPVRYHKMNIIIGDEQYEEVLISAGLWDLASLLEGPWVL
ncbi:hypothetical protein P168DRAFT_322406 [Aspergillus campestris IBT 28561]|uniref:Uncharacterized protein n=1 Tax=Aspergillus campestris (strain IBT 28561) TaxID=1392248 RepID=A0A2I1CRT6_ASPC2|nr:uncharacterized protein P168DRAFT_322406 [Aspergillus campestris IBT 28561]PKY00344.1 hypothetical protein P168DRAFT_322406 [Aspergillus campestris IBT 28561]